MSKAAKTGAWEWGDFVFDKAGESESQSPIGDRRCRALRLRNMATMRNIEQMVIVSLLGLFFRCLRTFSS